MTIAPQVVSQQDTPAREYRRDAFTISTDRARLDHEMVYKFLHTAPWCKNISREVVERSIRNSFCFGVFEGTQQVGFARVITDFATFAYVCDFFIAESHRGRGLAKWLITTILECEDLRSLRRRCIVTHEAHGLYRQMGFMSARRPEAYMELVKKDAYK